MALILLFVILFALMIIGAPVAVALGTASLVFVLLTGIPSMTVLHNMVNGINSFPLMAVPFFILAGHLMNTAGITNRIFNFARAAVGWLHGGLGHVNVGASVIFAGMSGAAVADAGGLGNIEIKAMRDAGYDTDFSRRHHGGLVDHRADHSAIAAAGHLRRHRQCLDRPAFRRRLHSRPADGRLADGHGGVVCHAARLSARPALRAPPLLHHASRRGSCRC